jgi:hypothetical protein
MNVRWLFSSLLLGYIAHFPLKEHQAEVVSRFFATAAN